LNIDSNYVNVAGVVALAKNTTLRVLWLSYNKARDAGAKALAANKTLVELHIKNNEVGEAGAGALAGNITLTLLSLGSNHIGSAGAEALAKSTTLKTLWLFNNKVGDAGAQALACNTGITELRLNSNRVGDAGAVALAGNTTITALQLWSNNVGDAGARALAGNTTLARLDLSSNNVGDAGAEALAGNTTLTTLDICDNGVGVEGTLALAKSTNLEVLRLSGNYVSIEGVEAMARSTTLRDLYLFENNAGIAGVEALARSITLEKFSVNCRTYAYPERGRIHINPPCEQDDAGEGIPPVFEAPWMEIHVQGEYGAVVWKGMVYPEMLASATKYYNLFMDSCGDTAEEGYLQLQIPEEFKEAAEAFYRHLQFGKVTAWDLWFLDPADVFYVSYLAQFFRAESLMDMCLQVIDMITIHGRSGSTDFSDLSDDDKEAQVQAFRWLGKLLLETKYSPEAVQELQESSCGDAQKAFRAKDSAFYNGGHSFAVDISLHFVSVEEEEVEEGEGGSPKKKMRLTTF